MPKDAYINARVDKRVKQRAEKVLAKVGLNTTDAVNLFLRRIILVGGLPFDLRIPNAETQEAIAETRAGGGTRHRGSTRQILQEIAKSDD